jgi:two-component system, NtrC family, sensor kinase
MFRYKPSIRKKIIFGYYAGIVVIIWLSLFTLIELWYIEKKVQFGEVVSEFFDSTLEIRRFEKNFFLYEKAEDYQENMQYVLKAQNILDKNIKGYKSLVIAQQLDRLREDLQAYGSLMERFAKLGGNNVDIKSKLEKAIRAKGKEIITISEEVSKTERERLQALLNKIRQVLIFSFISLSLLGIAIGQLLSRMVVKPLKALEEKMKLISEGKLETVSIKSKDQEIVSLTNAFNKMLKELEVRRKHLVQREKLASLGTLLSGVAHELNNPLSNISSSCQILIEEFGDADIEYKKELLGQIDEQTDRAKNIVRSLLEFSRNKDFKKEYLPLKSIFEETILFIKGEIPSKVQTVLDIPDDLLVFADKQRLQQAFLNLIKNAVESIPNEGSVIVKARKRVFMPEEGEKAGGCVYARFKGKCTGMCPSDDDTIDIEISDTGEGIPREVLSKIFDPFFTTKDVGKGSGLGLFIVQEIIEEHNGCIGVDSEFGKGTSFLIILPVKER